MGFKLLFGLEFQSGGIVVFSDSKFSFEKVENIPRFTFLKTITFLEEHNSVRNRAL